MHARTAVPFLLLFLVPTLLHAQHAAVDVLREDIELVLRGMPGVSIDRQLRVVSLGEEEGNVAVGILHRWPERDTDGAMTRLVHVGGPDTARVDRDSGSRHVPEHPIGSA